MQDADKAVKYLDRSVLKGRVIIVEKVSRAASAIGRKCPPGDCTISTWRHVNTHLRLQPPCPPSKGPRLHT